MIIRSMYQEDITIINIYAANIKAPKYTKETLTQLEGEIDKNIVIGSDFNAALSIMHRTSRQKINKETEDLNITIDQMEPTGIYRIFHPTAK